MGKPKQQQLPQEMNHVFGEWKPSDTADIQAVRSFNDTPESLAPALQSQYDRAQQRNASRLNSSYNQNIPQSARLAMQQQGDRDLTADYGSALNQSAYQANQAKLARQMGLAEMTIGRPVETKSYGYTTQAAPQGGGLLNTLVGGGLSMAAAF